MAYLEFDGTSNYNSLQASLQRRFSKGLTFGAVYTWSKSMTTAGSDRRPGSVQCPFGLSCGTVGPDASVRGKLRL